MTTDREFARFIRERDGRCVRCGWSMGLQAAHIFGRGKPATRHDPDNAVALCIWCHGYMDQHPAEKQAFFRRRMGDDAYEALQRKSNGVREYEHAVEPGLDTWRRPVKGDE